MRKAAKSEISNNFGIFPAFPKPEPNSDYKYNPDDFKVEDDYITEPGSMIIIFNNKNLEDDSE